MKMKDFLNGILDKSKTLQLNIDKKECYIFLSLGAGMCVIKSLTYNPFDGKWKMRLERVQVLSDTIPDNSKTLDNFYYLGARQSLLPAMDDPIDVEAYTTNVGSTIDISGLKLRDCQPYVHYSGTAGILCSFQIVL